MVVAADVGGYKVFSMKDRFEFVIGILFVHDIDEKLGYYRDTLRQGGKKHRCLELQFTILAIVFLIGGMFFCESVLAPAVFQAMDFAFGAGD